MNATTSYPARTSANKAADRAAVPSDFSVLEQTIREDQFGKWLAQVWSKILVVALVGVAGWYLYARYTDTQLRNRELAADSFSNVMSLSADFDTARQEWLSLTDDTKRAEVTEKLGKARTEFVRALQSLGDARAPYGQLASLVALAKREALVDAPTNEREIIEQLALRLQSQSSSSSQNLISDLQALGRARSTFAESARRAEGRAQLVAIARSPSVGRVVAAVTLAQTAQTPDQESEALAIIKEISSASPELAELLSEESERLVGRVGR